MKNLHNLKCQNPCENLCHNPMFKITPLYIRQEKMLSLSFACEKKKTSQNRPQHLHKGICYRHTNLNLRTIVQRNYNIMVDQSNKGGQTKNTLTSILASPGKQKYIIFKHITQFKQNQSSISDCILADCFIICRTNGKIQLILSFLPSNPKVTDPYRSKKYNNKITTVPVDISDGWGQSEIFTN